MIEPQSSIVDSQHQRCGSCLSTEDLSNTDTCCTSWYFNISLKLVHASSVMIFHTEFSPWMSVAVWGVRLIIVEDPEVMMVI